MTIISVWEGDKGREGETKTKLERERYHHDKHLERGVFTMTTSRKRSFHHDHIYREEFKA